MWFIHIFKNGKRLEENTKFSFQLSQGNEFTENYCILLKYFPQVFQKGYLFFLKQSNNSNPS